MITSYPKREVEVGGEFPAQAQFTINAGRKAFKTLISNLYSDKVKAVISELSANAYDAHVEAGEQDKPFKVVLPTPVEPKFSIRDYGTGLSQEFMLTKYTAAFLSTKEDSNLYNGEKGIGRLSALSLCDSYICSSYYNGMVYHYSICLNENGIPTIRLVNSEITDEPNGLYVEVPVNYNQVEDFFNKAAQIYSVYTLKPAIENGPELKSHSQEFILKASDNSWGLLGSGNTPQAVCSVYSYPLNPNVFVGLSDDERAILNSGVVIKFNIGDVHTAASRESLDYDDHTKNSIKAKLNLVKNELLEVVKAEFEGKSVYEQMFFDSSLFSARGKLSYVRNLAKRYYKGIGLPDSFDLRGLGAVKYGREKNWKTGNYRLKSDSITYIEPSSELELFFVDKKTKLKNRLKGYVTNNSDKIVVTVTAENETAILYFIKTYGKDPRTFRKVSELPIVASARGPRTKRGENHFYHFDSDADVWSRAWKIEEIDEENLENTYWVLRQGVVGAEFVSKNDLASQLWNFEALSEADNDIIIIGVSQTEVEKVEALGIKKFKDSYKELLERIQESNKQIIANLQYYKRNYENFPDNYLEKSFRWTSKDTLAKTIYNEFLQASNEFKQNEKLQQFINTTPRVKSVYVYKTEDLHKQYPLLAFVVNASSYWSPFTEAAQKDLALYIENKG